MTAYATRADLHALGLPAAALSGLSNAVLDQQLEAASRRCDSYFLKWGTPLPTPSEAVKDAVCAIAAYRSACVAGYAPENPDNALRLNHDDAIKWLERCADGTCIPCLQTEDATPSTDEMAPLIETYDTEEADDVWG